MAQGADASARSAKPCRRGQRTTAARWYPAVDRIAPVAHVGLVLGVERLQLGRRLRVEDLVLVGVAAALRLALPHPVAQLDLGVDQVPQAGGGGLLVEVLLLLVVSPDASVHLRVHLRHGRPGFAHLRQGQENLAVELPRGLLQGRGADGVGVLETLPGESPLGVLMVEEIDEDAIRQVSPQLGRGFLEVLSDRPGQRLGYLR